MRKTTAHALFLLAVMTTVSLPLASKATTDRNHLETTSRNSDSLIYKQSLEIIQNKVPLSYNEHVQKYINIFTSQKARFSRMLGLSKYYFPIYEKIFKERNVPAELKYISVIESSLNPHAVSRVGATGPWQFMYETGKIYGLAVNEWVDERKDPALACNAAASYLLDSYFMYDDWLLAIASYNCGRNNIKWAIEKADGQTDFWAIRKYLPVETQNYVPAFIATAYIMNNYWKHNINAAEPEFHVQTDLVPVNMTISLKDIARAANINLEELCLLNPAFKKQIINGSPEAPKSLIIPAAKTVSYANLYNVLNGKEITEPQIIHASYTDKPANADFVRHRVKKGETLLEIANHYGVEVQDIKVWNKLKSTTIVPGQSLKVREKISVSDTYITYKVKQGDTLSSIARQFNGATEEEIRVINQLESPSSVKPGMILRIIGG